MTKENYIVTNKLNDSKDLAYSISTTSDARRKLSNRLASQDSSSIDDSVFVNESKHTRLKAPSLPDSPSDFRSYQMKMRFYLSQDGVDETDLEDMEDSNKTVEDSPNGHWTKLDTEISVQKLFDFDSTYLGIDTEKGIEIAWNEMKFTKVLPPPPTGRQTSPVIINRFDSVESLECIYKKLKSVLDILIKLDHPNILKFHDYWYTTNDNEAKLVVITEYSSAGSLKKALDSTKMSKTKVKPQTYKRWLNQIVHAMRYLHKQKISIFQGHLNSETIFIQNNGVIKLTPTLLLLNNIGEVFNNLIRASASSGLATSHSVSNASQIKLTSDIAIKDIRAIGRIAVEIFCAHKKSAPPSPSAQNRPGLARFNNHSIEMICSMKNDDTNPLKNSIDNYDFDNDDSQKDFVFACFNVDRIKFPVNGKANKSSPPQSVAGTPPSPTVTSFGGPSSSLIEIIWCHPVINDIYNLRVLSVYSILKHFQETKGNKSKNKTGVPPSPSPNTKPPAGDKSNKAISDQSIPMQNADDAELNHKTNHAAGISHRRVMNNESFDLDQTTVAKNDESDTTLMSTSSDSKLEKMNRVSSSTFSFSSSKQSRFNQTYQITADQRKESLSFLTNDPQFQTLPRNFYGILEDIRYGLYPRLFKLDCESNSCSQQSLRHISSNSCVDYVIQQMTRRSSMNYLTGLNEHDLKKLQFINSNRKSLMKSQDSANTPASGKLKKNSADFHEDSYDDDDTEDANLNDEEEDEEDEGLLDDPSSFLSEFDQSSTTCTYRAVEHRRLVSEQCSVESNLADTKLIDLNLDLRFNDDLRRCLKCSFPIDILVSNLNLSNNFVSSNTVHRKIQSICNVLTNELIEFGLINKNDHELIAELFLQTVKDYLKKSISLHL